MVGRRRNEANPRHRVTQGTDVLANLAAGQLTAFAGLGTLRHLDLNLVGTGQILGGHTKAPRSHLLDARTQ